MSYVGIGTTDPNHPLEVEGQVFISNVEQNSTNLVPFEIYSDYTGLSTLTDSRQLRLRVTPSASIADTYHVDMGIDNVNGDEFFISNPFASSGGNYTGTRVITIDSGRKTRINSPIVAIGEDAGLTNQGTNSVAIGNLAGSSEVKGSIRSRLVDRRVR
jgi:hypothetical protein